ncbi:MAG: ABC transporter permease subunit [Planctomycetota bacterium]
MSSWFYLVYFSFRRQLRPKRLAVAVLLFILLIVVVAVMGAERSLSTRRFIQDIIEYPFGRFFLPVIALTFGTAVLGDEREDKTLVYLSTRPLPRWSLFLAKVLGSVPLVLVIALGTLLGICATATLVGGLPLPLLKVAWAFMPMVTFGVLAYLAFFSWLGAAFRNSTLIGVAYVFLVEFFMGSVPGVLKQVSISFYIRSMLDDAAEELGVAPREDVPELFQLELIEGSDAALVLAATAAGFMLLGMYWFSRREYRDLT